MIANRFTPAAAAMAALLALGACHQRPSAPKVRIERAWIRLPAVPGGEGAGYFTAVAATNDHLLAVSAPGVRIELHETMAQGTMISMRPIARIALPRGDKIAFAPGGRHLMILGLSPALKPGGRFPLSFRFAAAPAVTVEARLVGPGQSAPGDGD
jgi:copper(I)-binding protein